MQYDVVLRARSIGAHRSGITAPWQAGRRLCLLLGAWYPPFRGQFLHIASTTVGGGWAVEMDRPGMGHGTTSGEGRGVTQETETRRHHPSCLAVVLPCNPVWGRVMAILPPFIVAFTWIRASIELYLPI